MIKVLTGFGSNGEHGRPSHSVVAVREKAPFDVPRISGKKPTEEELLRSVAVSAATAVWSKSRTLFGNNRMSRVNLEWDEALRWIAVAGWDRRRTIQSSLELGSRRREHEMPIGGQKKEGLEHFVDDLEKLLETCMSSCLDGDVNFEGNLAGPEDSEIAISSIGTTVLKSVVGWFVGAAMPTVSPEASRMTTRMLMIATWSVAAYAINSSLLWLSPILANWYSTVRRRENSDWLLDHERESQAAKKMKSKHRKKKRRQTAHRSGKAIAEGALKPQTQTVSVEDRKETVFQIRQQCNENKSSSSGSQSSSSVDAVPSVISCSTEPSDSSTNYSSSPSLCSPIQFQRDAQNLLTPSHDLNGEASQQFKEIRRTRRQSPIDCQKLEAVMQKDTIPLVPKTNNHEATAAFPRPKKDSSSSFNPPPLPQCTSFSCQLPAPTAQVTPEPSLNLNAIVKPPPGFGHLVAPTAEFDAVEEDKRMEERLGSLLDDEFENDDIDALLHAGMESLSVEESTLNPSAAPFVSRPGFASLSPGSAEEKKGWKTEQCSLVSATKIAGVYGGSVW